MLDLGKISALFAQRKLGHALPQALYNDMDVFEFDMLAIYGQSWMLVGLECELPKAGATLAMNIGPWPIVVVRGRDGTLRAFHNSCRHRGAQICKTGHSSSPRLVCPYHKWTYELTGELVSAPRMAEDFEMNDHGLTPIAIEVLEGAVHICLSDNPPAFDEYRAKAGPLMAPHEFANAKLAHESVLVEMANWKLVMENARECYHCLTGHPELSASFPTGTTAYFDYDDKAALEAYNNKMESMGLPVGPVEGDWWQAMRFPLNPGFVTMSADGKPLVAKTMGKVGDGDIGTMRWALEPHSFCHTLGDFTFIFSALPVAPNETHVVAKWYVSKDAVEGVDYTAEGLSDIWNKTNIQDRDLAENNQKGVNSIGYKPGPYSPEAEVLVLRIIDWYCAKAKAYIDANS